MWLLLLIAACHESDGRTALMQDVLVGDNRVWMQRDPEQLAAKYSKMAADPYDFMRGSLSWMVADTTRPGGPRFTAGILTDSMSRLLVVGDPHPENLGTIALDGTIDLAFVDLDGATWGTSTFDLRRGALGLAAFVHPLEDCDCTADAVTAMAEGYTDALLAGALPDDAVTADLIDEATREGMERKRLLARTTDASGSRRFERTDTRVEPSPTDRARVERVLATTHPDWRVLDVVRRIGRGVASLPAHRFEVVVDRGDASDIDDTLFQVREVVDAPVLPVPPPAPLLFNDPAHRIHTATRLWPFREPGFGAVVDGDVTFKVSSGSSWFQELDHTKLLEDWDDGDWTRDDVVGLGRTMGMALAQAHLRSGIEPVDPDLGTDLTTVALDDLERLHGDHAAFSALLERTDPWLGAQELF